MHCKTLRYLESTGLSKVYVFHHGINHFPTCLGSHEIGTYALLAKGRVLMLQYVLHVFIIWLRTVRNTRLLENFFGHIPHFMIYNTENRG